MQPLLFSGEKWKNNFFPTLRSWFFLCQISNLRRTTVTLIEIQPVMLQRQTLKHSKSHADLKYDACNALLSNFKIFHASVNRQVFQIFILPTLSYQNHSCLASTCVPVTLKYSISPPLLLNNMRCPYLYMR